MGCCGSREPPPMVGADSPSHPVTRRVNELFPKYASNFSQGAPDEMNPAQVAGLVQEAGQKLTRAQEAGIQKALTLRLSKNKVGVTLVEVMNCVALYIDKAVPDYS